MSISQRLRQLDAYPKTLEDFRIKTYGGAIVTIISSILLVFLFISEVNDYLSPKIKEELFVDTSSGSNKLRINLDIVVHSIACDFLSLDAMDVTGEQHLQIEHNIYKRRLDLSGKPIEEPKKSDITRTVKTTAKPATNDTQCGDCYGAENEELGIKCCNTCDAIKKAYRKRKWAMQDPSKFVQCKNDKSIEKIKHAFTEGCQIYGYMEVNRVAGSFHIAPGDSFSLNYLHVHDIQPFSSSQFNTSHKIRHLSFGMNIPGKTNTLDNHEVITKGATSFHYYIKIVPTTFVKLDGSYIQTNQFSVTKSTKPIVLDITGENSMSDLSFVYEFSPLMVKYSETERSIGHLLTNTCAIIGGIFTVASIIDSFLYHSARVIQKKIELGKFN